MLDLDRSRSIYGDQDIVVQTDFKRIVGRVTVVAFEEDVGG